MSSKSAANSESLLDELQTTLAHGNVARRVETLRRVTDLFINNAVDYSDEHIRVFDDVFQCLIEQIEASARTLLANRLAPIAAAPPKIIRTLALDEVIEVSGPVLSKSERLDEATLIEIARTAHAQSGRDPATFIVTTSAQGSRGEQQRLTDQGVDRAILFVRRPFRDGVARAHDAFAH